MFARPRLARALVPAVALLLVGAYAFAQVGGTVVVPYQGRLEHSGTLVDDTVSMTFGFYSAPAGAALLDEATHDVTVRSGVFALDIGPVDRSVLDAPAVYLEIAVEGAVLGARQPLRAVPYAVQGRAGGPFVSQNAAVGEMGHGANWAGFAHKNVAGPDSYALLQNQAGETLVNAASGQRVKLRVNNEDMAELDATGTFTTTGAFSVGGARIEGLEVTSYTAESVLPDNVTVWDQTIPQPMTPVSSSLCALTRDRVNYVTDSFNNPEYASFNGECVIVDVAGTWTLRANASRAWHGHPITVSCAATCLRWAF